MHATIEYRLKTYGHVKAANARRQQSTEPVLPGMLSVRQSVNYHRSDRHSDISGQLRRQSRSGSRDIIGPPIPLISVLPVCIPYRALSMSQYSVGLARIHDLSITTDLRLNYPVPYSELHTHSHRQYLIAPMYYGSTSAEPWRYLERSQRQTAASQDNVSPQPGSSGHHIDLSMGYF